MKTCAPKHQLSCPYCGMTDTEILNWLEARKPPTRLYVVEIGGSQFAAETIREAVCAAAKAMAQREDPAAAVIGDGEIK